MFLLKFDLEGHILILSRTQGLPPLEDFCIGIKNQPMSN